MTETGRYRIELDREWSLEDLYLYSRTFEQLYFLFLSLDVEIGSSDRERIEKAFTSFPWQGGYSAVSFFNQLKFSTPRQSRPRILAIQKQSPGYLDLGLLVAVATGIAVSVKRLASAIDAANATYNNIYKTAQERKLLKLQTKVSEFEFERDQIRFILESNKELCQMLGIHSHSELNELTQNPYVTLQILLSTYRRMRTLCEYENRGKAHLTESAMPRLSRQPPKKQPRRKAP